MIAELVEDGWGIANTTNIVDVERKKQGLGAAGEGAQAGVPCARGPRAAEAGQPRLLVFYASSGLH